MMRMLVCAVLVVLPLLAHAQTNYPIVQKVNAVIVKGVQAPAIVRHFIINGLEPATSTPAALQQLIATEYCCGERSSGMPISAQDPCDARICHKNAIEYALTVE